MSNCTPEHIDELLPQTQCQLCEYEGCLPYARAIASGEAPITRCLPGGVEVLEALAALTGQPLTESDREDLIAKTKAPSLALIKEDLCIGCTKCIQACPVDAITGAAKQMHAVISDACTGCELCVPPCPMDCIDIIPLPTPRFDANQAREQHTRRAQRLTQQKQKRNKPKSNIEQESTEARQAYIDAAKARVKNKQKTWTLYE